MTKLILASASPRRKEILKKFGYEFEIMTSEFNEVKTETDPVKSAITNALGKAKEVYDRLEDKTDIIVLGADTVVFKNGKIFGKPVGAKEAEETLKTLSGKTHTVVSGYALIFEGKSTVGYDKSEVTFFNLSDNTIKEYVESGKPLDKAGAYGIQDDYPIVRKHTGSLYNIIGLPIEKIQKEKLFKQL